MDIPTPDLMIPTWSWGDSWLDLLWVILAILSLFPMIQLRGGASRVFFDIVGTFQADRMLQDAGAKQAAFNAIMLDGLSGIQESFQMLGDNIQMFVDSFKEVTIEVADARIEFEKFVQEGENLAKVTDEIVRMGETYGFAADASLAAGARMAQLSGIVGTGAMGAATEVGIKFALIGGMETEAAMTRLINLQQQTGFMYGELTRQQYLLLDAQEQSNTVRRNSMAILDQLNTIENRSAATMSQITFVMNQFASQADMTGESIGAMAAQSAVMIEAGEEQGKAGRALKMIYARLGADTNGAATTLQNFGVATHDSSGNLRALSHILKDLSGIYDTLEDSQKQSIAQAVAGNNHYVRFLKLAENVDRAQELQIQALLDQAKAQDEVDKRLEENVTAFRKAEAQLKNYRAEMGNELLPALTHVTEAQGRLTSALNDFVGTDVGGAAAQFVIMAQQFGKLAAGPFDMFINLMQIKVALMTQKAITDSMLGVELVRKEVYGRTQLIQGSITAGMHRQHELQSIIFVLEKMRTAVMDNMAMGRQDEILDLENQLRSNELKTQELKEQLAVQDFLIQGAKEGKTQAELRLALIVHEKGIMSALTADQEAAYRKNYANTIVQHEANIVQATELRRQFDMLSMEKQEQFLIEHARITQVGAANRKRAEQEYAAIMKSGNAQNHMGKQIRRVEETTEEVRERIRLKVQAAIKAEENGIKRVEQAYGQLGFKRLAGLEKQIKKEEKYILTQDEYIQNEIQRQAIDAQRAGDLVEQNRLTDVQAQLQKELNIALASTEGEKHKLVLIETALQRAMEELNIDIHNQGRVALDAAGGLGFLAGRLPAVGAAAETTEPKLTRATMTMNRFSMVAGMASMATMMFGDSKHAARASIILMTASMLPMLVQIGSVTQGLHGQRVAQEAANVATARSITLMKGLKKAAISSGFLALVVAAGFAISIIMEKFGAFDDAADTVDSYGNVVGTVTQETIDFAKANEDMPMSQIMTNIQNLQQEYGRLTEAIEGADGATASLLNTQLNAVNESLGNFQTLQSKTVADLFTEGQLDEGDIRAYFQIDDFQKEIDDFEKGVSDAGFFGLDLMPDFIAAHPLEDPLSELSGDLLLMEQSFKNGGQAQKDFFDFMRTQGFKNADDVLTFLRTMGVVFDEGVVDPIKSATEHLTTFSEQLFDFNNQREELFFGFSSANLTGDLMKQVINEGVENLINQTEVIQTNVFNGMTTDQVAKEIMDLIEEEAGLRGINISDSR